MTPADSSQIPAGNNTPEIPEHTTRIGEFMGPHGLKGGIKLFVLGDPKQLVQLKQVYVARHGWLRVQKVEPQLPAMVFSLVGFPSRESVEQLRGLAVYVKDEALPPLEEGCYYYHQLRGLKVFDASGTYRATVRDVIDTDYQDLLVIENDDGESILPLQAPYVQLLGPSHAPNRIQLSEDTPAGLLPE